MESDEPALICVQHAINLSLFIMCCRLGRLQLLGRYHTTEEAEHILSGRLSKTDLYLTEGGCYRSQTRATYHESHVGRE